MEESLIKPRHKATFILLSSLCCNNVYKSENEISFYSLLIPICLLLVFSLYIASYIFPWLKMFLFELLDNVAEIWIDFYSVWYKYINLFFYSMLFVLVISINIPIWVAVILVLCLCLYPIHTAFPASQFNFFVVLSSYFSKKYSTYQSTCW